MDKLHDKFDEEHHYFDKNINNLCNIIIYVIHKKCQGKFSKNKLSVVQWIFK